MIDKSAIVCAPLCCGGLGKRLVLSRQHPEQKEKSKQKEKLQMQPV